MPTIRWAQRSSRLTHSPAKTSMLRPRKPISTPQARAGGERSNASFPRQLVVDAFDVIVHAEDLAVVEMGAALAFDRLVVLAEHRTLERVQLAVRDRGFGVHGELFHVVGHVGIGGHEK